MSRSPATSRRRYQKGRTTIRSGFAAYSAKRFLFGIVTLIAISLLVFMISGTMGNTTRRRLGLYSTASQQAAFDKQFDLSSPLMIRYIRWALSALRGDFGISYVGAKDIGGLVWPALLNSVVIAGLAVTIGCLLAAILAVVASMHRASRIESGINRFLLIGVSVPEFVTAVFVVALLSVSLGLFPATSSPPPGDSVFDHPELLVLPTLSLLPVTTGYIAKSLIAAMAELGSEDFVILAEMRGLSRRKILAMHVLPNAIIPVIPVVAITIAWLTGAVVVVEELFNYPGIGSVLFDAVSHADTPVLLAATAVLGSLIIVVNLASDVLTAILDPRIRDVML